MNESYDAFLGGKFHAYQPKKGFRAGTDTILLAAAVPAQKDDHVLEIGAGSGVGLMALATRIEGLNLYGVELLEENTERANRNLNSMSLNGKVITENIFESRHPWLKLQFDHVFMNPPFYPKKTFSSPKEQSRAEAHILQNDLKHWIEAGLKRVRAKGSLTMIFPTEGLKNILMAIPDNNAIAIRPIQSKANSCANRVIINIKTQQKHPLRLYEPIVLQLEDTKRTSVSEALTRNAQCISW